MRQPGRDSRPFRAWPTDRCQGRAGGGPPRTPKINVACPPPQWPPSGTRQYSIRPLHVPYLYKSSLTPSLALSRLCVSPFWVGRREVTCGAALSVLNLYDCIVTAAAAAPFPLEHACHAARGQRTPSPLPPSPSWLSASCGVPPSIRLSVWRQPAGRPAIRANQPVVTSLLPNSTSGSHYTEQDTRQQSGGRRIAGRAGLVAALAATEQ